MVDRDKNVIILIPTRSETFPPQAPPQCIAYTTLSTARRCVYYRNFSIPVIESDA